MKKLSWDGNFQIKFFSGIFKMEHLSNRNLIGTFQKLNDRKYHFLRKIGNYTILEGQERLWVSKNQKLSFKPQPEMVYSNIFPKFLFPGILKNSTKAFQLWTFHVIFNPINTNWHRKIHQKNSEFENRKYTLKFGAQTH